MTTETRLPGTIPPAVRGITPRLPQSYEAAKVALAECAQVDECQDWADKAAALASYARQADDDTLYKTAIRIQARAVRRAGDLLKEFDARGGSHSKKEGALPFASPSAASRQQVAANAGMSLHQAKTAVRVANVPETQFEAAVESDRPPTVTKLAELGKQTRPVEDKKAPEGFAIATQLLGDLEELAGFCRSNEPEFVAEGVMQYESEGAKRHIAIIDEWLRRFVGNLKE